MTRATVSCIVPALDAERFIGEALRSILRQTHPPFEVIVAVDDATTDRTEEVARQVSDQVTIVRRGQRGYLQSRDAGLAAATGALVAFLDADDLWEPEKTARQFAVLRAKPDVDFVTAHYQNFWDADRADEEVQYRDHPLSRPLAGYTVQTILAPRRVFDRFGSFTSEGNPSDTAWFARAVARGARIETLPDVLVRRRLHGSNLSRATGSSLTGLFDLIAARRQGRA